MNNAAKETMTAIQQVIVKTTPTNGMVAIVQGADDNVFGISYYTTRQAFVALMGKLGQV